jgi:endonuclease G
MSEILRDERVMAALAGTLDDDRATASPQWREQWDAVDQAANVSPARQLTRRSADSRQGIRDHLVALIGSKRDGGEKFAEFLNANGHNDVVNAVPKSTSNEIYVEGLALALDRRDLLDARLLKDLQEWTGLPLLAQEEPMTRAPSVPDYWGGDPPAISAREPNSMILDAVAAIEDLPVNSVKNVELIITGSQWRDRLLGPDGRVTTASETIKRLAADQSKQELAWFVKELLQIADPMETDRLARLSRVLHLTGPQERRISSQEILADEYEPTSVNYLSGGAIAARGVALVQLPQESGKFLGGTGWMLTPSLLVIAAHLISGQDGGRPRDDAAAEFARMAVVRLDFDAPQSVTKSVAVERIELLDHNLDLAILRLTEPISERTPLCVNPELLEPHGEMLSMIHHPRLGPKQVSQGRLLETDAHQAIYTMASEAGSAGAPVFDRKWRVVAIHRAWQNYRASPEATPIRAKCGTTISALLAALRHISGVSGALWYEVAAAQPALRVVDSTLYVQLSRLEQEIPAPIVPMIIQLAEASVALDHVPGLIVDSVADHIVSARGNRESVDALAKMPEVLSVKTSLPVGTLECARSIPHVGATRVHQEFAELGERALVAVIDQGVDIFHRALWDENGRTRVIAMWDQKDARARAHDPNATTAISMSDAGAEMVRMFGLRYGALYLADDLHRFIDKKEPLPVTLVQRGTGIEHGTAVCSVAAGRRTGDFEEHFFGGVAPAAALAVVRYDLQGRSVGYSKGHIDALAFIDKLADLLGRPVVVNISNGMNTGAHDGTSELEKRCESFCDNGSKPGRVVVKSAGNERDQGRHARLTVAQGSALELRWHTAPSNAADWEVEAPTEIIELWFDPMDRYEFRVKGRTGGWSGRIAAELPPLKEFLGNGNYVRAELCPYHADNGAGYLKIIIDHGNRPDVESGEWALEITGVSVKRQKPIDAWVEESLHRELKFTYDTQNSCTITVPGTAMHVITVGAVGTDRVMRPPVYSSVGPGRTGLEKPDLVAPGDRLRPAFAGSDDGIFPIKLKPGLASGTSFAAAHVTGAIALALSARAKKPGAEQWNAVQVQKALTSTVRHLNVHWNERTGYGELDAAAFFRALDLE